ncbi:MAG: lipoyl(octanoyl) transferase LipB [Candidatus Neomarinimicrobiota bacterium]
MINIYKQDEIKILDLGHSPYREVWDLQKKMHKDRINSKINDTLIFVEHESVYTLGKNANKDHLLQNKDDSIDVFDIERGGDITYHGPGQLVVYPILDLTNYKKSVSWYMRKLEQVTIDLLFEYDIKATRSKGLTGVWVDDEKIAAQGVKISRWVTMHGFSINVNTNLDFYDNIIPCGIFDRGVTSISEILGRLIDMNRIKMVIIEKFNDNFKKDIL